MISIDNLLGAWKEFRDGKRARRDVQEFSFHLMDNILTLGNDLRQQSYRHGGYEAFNIGDPKPRSIHKAQVRDRLVHHAIYRKLYPFFDRTFIGDSYSCRIDKGSHKALKRFRLFAGIVSKNHTRTVWVLKGDIRKFFANIDHEILLNILKKWIPDEKIMGLLKGIILSFEARPGVGLPLGNLTSQLLVNIYMNEFDQFVKHKLKAKYYIRYADDFVFFSDDRFQLEALVSQVQNFLSYKLRLQLHSGKVHIKSVASGVDFLGWVHFNDHRVLRTASKRRMMRRLAVSRSDATVASYCGLLKHGNTHTLKESVLFDKDHPQRYY